MINAILIGVLILSVMLVVAVIIPKRSKLHKHTPVLQDADWDSTKWRWIK